MIESIAVQRRALIVMVEAAPGDQLKRLFPHVSKLFSRDPQERDKLIGVAIVQARNELHGKRR